MYIFKPKTNHAVKEYIDNLDAENKKIFKEFYQTVKKTIPENEEGVSYGMPAFFYLGQPFASLMLTKKHYGFYPYGSSAIEELRDQLREYSTSSGTIRFPLGKKLPLALIAKIVKWRAREIEENLLRKGEILPKISAPALRALEPKKITKLRDLKKFTEKEIAELHGIGPNALGTLKKAMNFAGFSFKVKK